MGDVTLYVGENLSYENEKIFHASAAELTEYRGDALSVVTACNEKGSTLAAVHGICDEEFLRREGAYDKGRGAYGSLSSFVFRRILSAMMWGAGTGSVSVEMALRAWKGRSMPLRKRKMPLLF